MALIYLQRVAEFLTIGEDGRSYRVMKLAQVQTPDAGVSRGALTRRGLTEYQLDDGAAVTRIMPGMDFEICHSGLRLFAAW